MKEKRSIGIGIFTFFNILCGINAIVLEIGFIYFFNDMFRRMMIAPLDLISVQVFSSIFSLIFIGILLIVSNVNLLKFKNWARRLSLIAWTAFFCHVILLVFLNSNKLISAMKYLIPIILGLVYFLAQVYYFTRPKIKEQFK